MHTTRREIIEGIATILWGDAWASHAEEHNCHNLSGCSVEDHMPEIPYRAWKEAFQLARRVERDNGAKLDVLYQREVDAHGLNPEVTRESAERFGNCLAWEAMGAGVSWADYNPEHALKMPFSWENCELRFYADDACEEESEDGRKPCTNCSAYVVPGDKCSNCLTPAPAEEEEGEGAEA